MGNLVQLLDKWCVCVCENFLFVEEQLLIHRYNSVTVTDSVTQCTFSSNSVAM